MSANRSAEKPERRFRQELFGALPNPINELRRTLLHALNRLVDQRPHALTQVAHQLRRIAQNIHSAKNAIDLHLRLSDVVLLHAVDDVVLVQVEVLRLEGREVDHGVVDVGDHAPGGVEQRFEDGGNEGVVEEGGGDRVCALDLKDSLTQTG